MPREGKRGLHAIRREATADAGSGGIWEEVRPRLGETLGHGAYAALPADLTPGPVRLLDGRGAYRRFHWRPRYMPHRPRRRRLIGNHRRGDQDSSNNCRNFDEPRIHVPHLRAFEYGHHDSSAGLMKEGGRLSRMLFLLVLQIGHGADA